MPDDNDKIRTKAANDMLDHLNWSTENDRPLSERAKIIDLTMDLVEKFVAEDAMNDFYRELIAGLAAQSPCRLCKRLISPGNGHNHGKVGSVTHNSPCPTCTERRLWCDEAGQIIYTCPAHP